MPTFEYKCEEHGIFDIFWQERHDTYPCPICERPAEHKVSFPNMDRTAFSMWNNYTDDRVGTFTDKKRYLEAVDRAGYRIKEPGSDQVAEEKGKAWVEEKKKELTDQIGTFFQERSLDQIRSMLAVDKQIYDAQQAGDEAKLKSLGCATSLDECYQKANSE